MLTENNDDAQSFIFEQPPDKSEEMQSDINYAMIVETGKPLNDFTMTAAELEKNVLGETGHNAEKILFQLCRKIDEMSMEVTHKLKAQAMKICHKLDENAIQIQNKIDVQAFQVRHENAEILSKSERIFVKNNFDIISLIDENQREIKTYLNTLEKTMMTFKTDMTLIAINILRNYPNIGINNTKI